MAMYSARRTHAAHPARVTAWGAADAPIRQGVAHGVAQAAGQGSGVSARRATLDGVVIEGGVRWWRSLPPRTRLALAGVTLALLAALGAWGVAQVGPPPLTGAQAAHSPVALLGRLCVWLFGVGAYPTLALLLALGALWMAEGVARRRLLRRWLTAPTVALWLLIELGGRLVGGQAAGGAFGDALAMPLAHAPLSLAQLLVLLVAAPLVLLIGVTLANDAANALVALPGATLHALRSPRRPNASARTPTPVPVTPVSVAHRSRSTAGGRVVAAGANHAPVASRGATDEANRLAAAALHQRGRPLIEAWVGKATYDNEGPGGDAARGEKPGEPPDDWPEDVVALAEELAVRTQQALLAQRAVTQVYPLRITATTIHLCVRPVERLKRDAAGRSVTDAQGAPVVVRTRVSRILALRDELAQALGAPTLRLTPLSPDEAPDTDQPAIVVELPRG